jgi:hypothetical protein
MCGSPRKAQSAVEETRNFPFFRKDPFIFFFEKNVGCEKVACENSR